MQVQKTNNSLTTILEKDLESHKQNISKSSLFSSQNINSKIANIERTLLENYELLDEKSMFANLSDILKTFNNDKSSLDFLYSFAYNFVINFAQKPVTSQAKLMFKVILAIYYVSVKSRCIICRDIVERYFDDGFNEWPTDNSEKNKYVKGEAYYWGIAGNPDYVDAAYYFQLAASNDNFYAQYRLGHMNEMGLGMTKNLDLAYDLYQKAANQSYPPACFKVASLLSSGLLHNKQINPQQVFSYYKIAAQAGHIESSYNVGLCYKDGYGVRNDNTKAFKWINKAALEGFANAQAVLGRFYEQGIGVVKDLKKAVEYYKLAADQGNKDAQANLGRTYFEGSGIGKDYKEAFKWSMKAAEQQHPDSQYQVAEAYDKGDGIEQDEKMACMWYEKAAKNGHAKAQNKMGEIFLTGKIGDKRIIVKESIPEAVSYFKLSASQGNVDAIRNLAKIYARGRIKGKKDPKTAFQLYEQAAKQEDLESQYQIGYSYYLGKGVEHDHKKAFNNLSQAANKNHPKALYYLGCMYLDGQHVPQDKSKGFDLINQSAGKGYRKAINKIQQLGNEKKEDYIPSAPPIEDKKDDDVD